MKGEQVVCTADHYYRYDSSGACCGTLVPASPTRVRRPCARPYLFDCDVLYATGLRRNGYEIYVLRTSITANGANQVVSHGELSTCGECDDFCKGLGDWFGGSLCLGATVVVDAGQLNHSARMVCIFGTNIGARHRAYARIAEYEIASAWDLPADPLMIGCWEVSACVGAGGTVCVYDHGCSVLVSARLPYFFC